jgi:hypothetical protein
VKSQNPRHFGDGQQFLLLHDFLPQDVHISKIRATLQQDLGSKKPDP